MKLYDYLRQILDKVDNAVFWGGMTRLCLFITTPLTILFIAAYFTPELQGYHYTFVSLIALQVFGELGLGQVIVMFASHEWSKLRLDEFGMIAGDPNNLSRLISLGRLAFKWFAVAGTIIPVGLGLAGFLFFSQKASTNVDWIYPWLVLCGLTGITLSLFPVWSLLNGCHQVTQVNFFRFWDNIIFNIALFLAIASGLALWALVIATAARLIWSGAFLGYKYSNFLKTFTITPIASNIKWSNEIWPMQWRISVSWLSGYFAFSIFTPAMFHFHGPILAGQTGMTLLLFEAISSIGSIWLTAKGPRFGSFIAEKRYQDLDQLFLHTTKMIAVVSTISALTFWSFLYLIYYINNPLSIRFLPLLPTGIFLIAQVLNILTSPMALYLRAHKREPLMALSVIQGGLSVVSVLILGKYFAAIGISVGCLLVNIIIVPATASVWYRCRKIWHIDEVVGGGC